MKNPDFKKASLAVMIAIVVSVLLLAAACILPGILINRLSRMVLPRLDLAIYAVADNNFANAARLAEEVSEGIESELDTLELFFEHEIIYELYGSASAAVRIAPTEDPSQLLEELCAAYTTMQYLVRINRASLYNFF